MRRVADDFNRRFGETLVVPEGNIPKVGARVRDLQEPERKMSTTGGTAKGTVYVDEERGAILKKFKGAQTDSGTEIRRAPDKAGISNLIEILAIVRGATPEAVEQDFAGSGYGAFKVAVGEEVAEWLAPVREAYLELREDTDRIEDILEAGAEKAAAIASGVVADVREVMGVGPPASRQAARHRLRRDSLDGAEAPRLDRSVGPAA
jgi:tryptophanyl-tRNA synthetase